MGVQDFYTVMSQMLNKAITNYEKLPKTKNNLYIDGNFILFSGAIEKNLELPYPEKEYEIALLAKKSILNHLSIFSNYKIAIDTVYFFTDGKRPPMKNKTSKRRPKYFDIMFALNTLCSMLEQESSYKFRIIKLVVGEGESECVLQSLNSNKNAFILTNDSDTFHIAYKRCVVSSKTTYLILKKFQAIYNLNQCNTWMYPFTFRVLCFLQKTDYTQSLFTNTMVKTLLNLNIQCEYITRLSGALKNIAINYTIDEDVCRLKENNCFLFDSVYKKKDVAKTIVLFLQIIYILKYKLQYKGIIFPKMLQNRSKMVGDLKQTLSIITWAVNYSLLGAKYTKYDKTLPREPVDVDPLSFFAFLLGNTSGLLKSYESLLPILNV